MGGLKVNAKEKRVGSRLDTLKEGKEFLQAKWPKFFRRIMIRKKGFLLRGRFCVLDRCCGGVSGSRMWMKYASTVAWFLCVVCTDLSACFMCS